jgi:P-type Ca2+ transporter type 2B
MCFLGIFGIEDPVRPQVPTAIDACRKAGIEVCMVTGDNIDTAVSIAKQCNILRLEDFDSSGVVLPGCAMTGPEFRKQVTDSDGVFHQSKFDKIATYLKVLARSTPDDKHTLVSGYMAGSAVVAVTGDGTNDAPALKKADVGFAMGIAGTQVAKDAADIILMDDNFSSIVTACNWGRNVHDSIAKFVQFQLTVNLVAMTISVIGASVKSESPLKAVQMLWVNLIMDSLAALSLGTESPNKSQMTRPPYAKDRSIISTVMIWNILGQAVFQIGVLVAIILLEEEYSVEDVFLFNTFVFMQLFNQLNSRKVFHEMNVFEGLFSNWIFIAIWLIEILFQYLIIQHGGSYFQTGKGLKLSEWALSVALGLLAFPAQFIIVSLAKIWPSIRDDGVKLRGLV